MSRLLHYELLPLIEHVTKKKLRPTYTYMAGYTKGGDLPAHTDRQDCQYTVSVVLDKPEGSSWPIYFDKVKQKGKNKGRVKNVSKKEDCVSCDADGIPDEISFTADIECFPRLYPSNTPSWTSLSTADSSCKCSACIWSLCTYLVHICSMFGKVSL